MFVLRTFPGLHFCFCDKHCDQQQIREECSYLIYRLKSIIRKQTQEPKEGTKADTTKELCLPACSGSQSASSLSYTIDGPARDDTTHSGLGPAASISNQENSPTNVPTANLTKVSSWVCQVDNKANWNRAIGVNYWELSVLVFFPTFRRRKLQVLVLNIGRPFFPLCFLLGFSCIPVIFCSDWATVAMLHLVDL